MMVAVVNLQKTVHRWNWRPIRRWPQRSARVLEDRTRRRRCAPAASHAARHAILATRPPHPSARRAGEPIWPALTVQVIQTVRVSPEPPAQMRQALRVIGAADRVHKLGLNIGLTSDIVRQSSG
jgi:hypothetical protein